MNDLVPAYLYPVILGGTAAMIAAVLIGLNRSLKLAGWAESESRPAFQRISILLVALAVIATVLSWFGAYQGTASGTPTIQYGLVVPLLIGVVLYWRWPTLRRAVQAVPQSWLVGVQLYRLLGVIFLILYAQGRAPAAFAWPAGTGDFLVGLLAPIVAIAYARKGTNAALWVRVWNWLGITDLVVALTTGFLTSPSQLQRLAFDLPNNLISAFPLVLIPVFLVPLSLLFHMASLHKLSQAQTRQTNPNPALA